MIVCQYGFLLAPQYHQTLVQDNADYNKTKQKKSTAMRTIQRLECTEEEHGEEPQANQ
jgi:hypothetical protein